MHVRRLFRLRPDRFLSTWLILALIVPSPAYALRPHMDKAGLEDILRREQPVNVNSADEAALTQHGVPPVMAAAIAQERAAHGRFASAGDFSARMHGKGPGIKNAAWDALAPTFTYGMTRRHMVGMGAIGMVAAGVTVVFGLPALYHRMTAPPGRVVWLFDYHSPHQIDTVIDTLDQLSKTYSEIYVVREHAPDLVHLDKVHPGLAQQVTGPETLDEPRIHAALDQALREFWDLPQRVERIASTEDSILQYVATHPTVHARYEQAPLAAVTAHLRERFAMNQARRALYSARDEAAATRLMTTWFVEGQRSDDIRDRAFASLVQQLMADHPGAAIVVSRGINHRGVAERIQYGTFESAMPALTTESSSPIVKALTPYRDALFRGESLPPSREIRRAILSHFPWAAVGSSLATGGGLSVQETRQHAQHVIEGLNEATLDQLTRDLQTHAPLLDQGEGRTRESVWLNRLTTLTIAWLQDHGAIPPALVQQLPPSQRGVRFSQAIELLRKTQAGMEEQQERVPKHGVSNVRYWVRRELRELMRNVREDPSRCSVGFERVSTRYHLVKGARDQWWIHLHSNAPGSNNGLLFRIRRSRENRAIVGLGDPMAESWASDPRQTFVPLKGVVPKTTVRWLVKQAFQAVSAEQKALIRAMDKGPRAQYVLASDAALGLWLMVKPKASSSSEVYAMAFQRVDSESKPARRQGGLEEMLTTEELLTDTGTTFRQVVEAMQARERAYPGSYRSDVLPLLTPILDPRTRTFSTNDLRAYAERLSRMSLEELRQEGQHYQDWEEGLTKPLRAICTEIPSPPYNAIAHYISAALFPASVAQETLREPGHDAAEYAKAAEMIRQGEERWAFQCEVFYRWDTQPKPRSRTLFPAAGTEETAVERAQALQDFVDGEVRTLQGQGQELTAPLPLTAAQARQFSGDPTSTGGIVVRITGVPPPALDGPTLFPQQDFKKVLQANGRLFSSRHYWLPSEPWPAVAKLWEDRETRDYRGALALFVKGCVTPQHLANLFDQMFPRGREYVPPRSILLTADQIEMLADPLLRAWSLQPDQPDAAPRVLTVTSIQLLEDHVRWNRYTVATWSA